MFKQAKIQKIFNVKLLRQTHLYWENRDIDLELESLEYPEKYPLLHK